MIRLGDPLQAQQDEGDLERSPAPVLDGSSDPAAARPLRLRPLRHHGAVGQLEGLEDMRILLDSPQTRSHAIERLRALPDLFFGRIEVLGADQAAELHIAVLDPRAVPVQQGIQRLYDRWKRFRAQISHGESTVVDIGIRVGQQNIDRRNERSPYGGHPRSRRVRPLSWSRGRPLPLNRTTMASREDRSVTVQQATQTQLAVESPFVRMPFDDRRGACGPGNADGWLKDTELILQREAVHMTGVDQRNGHRDMAADRIGAAHESPQLQVVPQFEGSGLALLPQIHRDGRE
ncbi:hypothetical protein [Nocardia sp. NPDC059154]|uniref:hypothetical protein n=1 Tax=Nocardia sp. NPDC059154 TaxID=3346744 RepID=UPI0036BEE5DB